MELVPQPLGNLVRRARREAEQGSVFDLPLTKMWRGPKGDLDLSRRFHGERAGTPVGPAAGPHTQLAQNIALSYLAGARIMELKTVQIMDTLQLPRPCIDATNIGFNVEWSQELRIPQSTEEYAKAALLLAALRRMGLPPEQDAAHASHLFDLSVGYDLKGIQSEAVTGFIRNMLDAGPVLDRLREGLPADLAELRDLAVDPALTSCITLSTFHGCPAHEIEHIARYLLEDIGVHVVVKLNPTLLGFERVNTVLREHLGYTDLTLDPAAFEHDLQWDQALEMIGRLRQVAKARGKRFGVKLTNTLVVNNHKDFFPSSEKQMYMSGQPLHVISTQLLAKLRRALPLVGEGATEPLMYTFSAGIDQHNFPLAASADLCPITTCTDLLRPGGYTRLPKYLERLEDQMRAAGAKDLEGYILRAHGHAADAAPGVADAWATLARDRGWVVPEDLASRLAKSAEALSAGATGEAALAAAGFEGEGLALAHGLWVHETGTRNAETVARLALEDPRYAEPKNNKAPKKIGSTLELFDCTNCDKCVPVCPNDANFVYEVAPMKAEAPVWHLSPDGVREEAPLAVDIEEVHQLATFVDFCNACGNCDVFCPEDGGPYNVKPHWFGSKEACEAESRLDGFYLEGPRVIAGRRAGRAVRLELEAEGAATYVDGPVEVRVDLSGPAPVLLEHSLTLGVPDHVVRAADILVLKALLEGVLRTVNPVSAGVTGPT
jgi:putative selenate reductase